MDQNVFFKQQMSHSMFKTRWNKKKVNKWSLLKKRLNNKIIKIIIPLNSYN